MTKGTDYLASEARWLLSFGTPALDVAKALHRKPVSMYGMARRHNLADLQEAFANYRYEDTK